MSQNLFFFFSFTSIMTNKELKDSKNAALEKSFLIVSFLCMANFILLWNLSNLIDVLGTATYYILIIMHGQDHF